MRIGHDFSTTGHIRGNNRTARGVIPRQETNVIRLCCCGLLLGATLSAAESGVEIGRLMSAYGKLGRCSGAVVVGMRGRVVYRGAFGAADLAGRIPNRTTTVFPIGSISKQFTAAAVMKLVEQGRIDLHKPVTTYLPDYPRATGDSVTIHHLLNHTSGIPSLFQSGQGLDEYTLADTLKPISLEGLVGTFRNKPLLSPPGSAARYSNSGYILLAYLIERVSGMSYGEYLRKEIFRPAGLERTFVGACDKSWRAEMSTGFGKERQVVPSTDPSWGMGSGNILSTVEDLYRWDRSLQQGLVLSKASVRAMSTASENAWYGYAWFLKERDGRRIVEHSGTGPGSVAWLYRIPAEEIAVAILTNHTHAEDTFTVSVDNVRRIAEQIVDLLHGKPVDFPPEAGPGNQATAAYEGEYRFGGGEAVVVTRQAGEMVARAAGESPWSFYSTMVPGLDSNLPEYKRAFELVAAFARGDYQVVRDTLPGPESRRPPASLFENIWKDALKENGKLRGFRIYEAAGGRAKVAMLFERNPMDLHVVLNDQGEIAGFHWGSGLPVEVRLIPLVGDATGQCVFFADGYPIGRKDLLFRFLPGKRLILQNGSVVKESESPESLRAGRLDVY